MAVISLIFFVYWMVDIILIFLNRKGENLRYILEMAVDCAGFIVCLVLGKATDTMEAANMPTVLVIASIYFVLKMMIKRFVKKG